MFWTSSAVEKNVGSVWTKGTHQQGDDIYLIQLQPMNMNLNIQQIYCG